MARSSEVIFLGTAEDAWRIYHAIHAECFTEPEQYILRRYLDLTIPANLEKYDFMDDRPYHKILSMLLEKIPAEAKNEL